MSLQSRRCPRIRVVLNVGLRGPRGCSQQRELSCSTKAGPKQTGRQQPVEWRLQQRDEKGTQRLQAKAGPLLRGVSWGEAGHSPRIPLGKPSSRPAQDHRAEVEEMRDYSRENNLRFFQVLLEGNSSMTGIFYWPMGWRERK